jgi:hypothetical protein
MFIMALAVHISKKIKKIDLRITNLNIWYIFTQSSACNRQTKME